jgi:hypothetical protein
MRRQKTKNNGCPYLAGKDIRASVRGPLVAGSTDSAPILGRCWKDFINSHMSVMAGIDFFTVEVLTWRESRIE